MEGPHRAEERDHHVIVVEIPGAETPPRCEAGHETPELRHRRDDLGRDAGGGGCLGDLDFPDGVDAVPGTQGLRQPEHERLVIDLDHEVPVVVAGRHRRDADVVAAPLGHGVDRGLETGVVASGNHRIDGTGRRREGSNEPARVA